MTASAIGQIRSGATMLRHLNFLGAADAVAIAKVLAAGSIRPHRGSVVNRKLGNLLTDRLAEQLTTQRDLIEFVFPSRNDQSGHSVAGHVRDRTAHAEKAVDPEDKGHSRDRYRRYDGHSGYKRDERGPLHAASSFGGKQGHTQNCELLQEGQVGVRCLSNEKRSESHVETRSISVKSIASRHNEADQRFRAA